jgi:hypothetical protein
MFSIGSPNVSIDYKTLMMVASRIFGLANIQQTAVAQFLDDDIEFTYVPDLDTFNYYISFASIYPYVAEALVGKIGHLPVSERDEAFDILFTYAIGDPSILYLFPEEIKHLPIDSRTDAFYRIFNQSDELLVKLQLVSSISSLPKGSKQTAFNDFLNFANSLRDEKEKYTLLNRLAAHIKNLDPDDRDDAYNIFFENHFNKNILYSLISEMECLTENEREAFFYKILETDFMKARAFKTTSSASTKPSAKYAVRHIKNKFLKRQIGFICKAGNEQIVWGLDKTQALEFIRRVTQINTDPKHKGFLKILTLPFIDPNKILQTVEEILQTHYRTGTILDLLCESLAYIHDEFKVKVFNRLAKECITTESDHNSIVLIKSIEYLPEVARLDAIETLMSYPDDAFRSVHLYQFLDTLELPSSQQGHKESLQSKLRSLIEKELTTSLLHRHLEDPDAPKVLNRRSEIHVSGEREIDRIMDPVAAAMWSKAYSCMPEVWKKAGFDYIPIEPILDVTSAGSDETKMKTLALRGETFERFQEINKICNFYSQEQVQELTRQTGLIVETMIRNGIVHGDPHVGNFVIVPKQNLDGSIDTDLLPRIYCIDFEHAKPIKTAGIASSFRPMNGPNATPRTNSAALLQR